MPRWQLVAYCGYLLFGVVIAFKNGEGFGMVIVPLLGLPLFVLFLVLIKKLTRRLISERMRRSDTKARPRLP